MNSERKTTIKKAILDHPYNLIFILSFLGFIIINFFLNKTYFFFIKSGSYYLWFYITFTLLFITIALLVALNISLASIRIHNINLGKKLTKKNINKKETSITSIGIFTGLLAGSCPACFAGLLPAFLGLFGLSISTSNLPLAGIELQIISTLLLLVGIIMLSKNPSCKINKNKSK